MGMPVRLVLHASGGEAAREAAAAAFARIAALDAMLSDYRGDSELRRLELRAQDAWVRVSPELLAILTRALEIARQTDGAFDPTIRPLVALWRRARAERRLPDPNALDAARRLVDWTAVHLDANRAAVRFGRPGMQLDLGGIAKGFVTQSALEILRERGVTSALVEAGGDIAVSGAPPGRAGWVIDVPGADPGFADRAARLADAALATSGPAAQFVEIDGVRHSHVIDPRSGHAVTSNRFARVIARDAMTADALATALTIVSDTERPIVLGRFPGVVATVHAEPKSVAGSGRVSSPLRCPPARPPGSVGRSAVTSRPAGRATVSCRAALRQGA